MSLESLLPGFAYKMKPNRWILLLLHLLIVLALIAVPIAPVPVSEVAAGLEECEPDSRGYTDAGCLFRNDAKIEAQVKSVRSTSPPPPDWRTVTRLALALIAGFAVFRGLGRSLRVVPAFVLGGAYVLAAAVGILTWVELSVVLVAVMLAGLESALRR